MAEQTMVERVAKAIHAKANPGEERYFSESWRERTYKELASAAIEAMREPSGVMADAGETAFSKWEEAEDYLSPVSKVWQTMIAAALAEERRAASPPKA